MKLITTLAMISLGIAATAQQTLTIEECREMALKNNHEIKAAQSKTEGARYTQKSYRSNYLPSLTLNLIGAYSTLKGEEDINVPVIGDVPVFKPGADFKPQTEAILQHLGTDAASQMWKAQNLAGYLFFPGVTGSMGFETGPMFLAGLTLQQPLYMGGKIANAHKMASLAVDASEANETLTEANVIEATDQAYALVVKAKEMQKVAKRYNDVLQELMDNVVKAKNHGMKTGNDVLKVQVKLNESELKMQKASNAVTLAKMNLCHKIGVSLTEEIDVADTYPEMETKEGSVEARPESKMLSKKVEVAEAKTKVERSAMLPVVGLMLMGNYVNGIKVNGDMTVSGKNQSFDEKLLNDFAFTALVNVKIPLFNFGKDANKTRASKCELEQARLEQQNLTEQMELEKQRSANILDEAEKELYVADKSLEQATENMRSSKSLFDNGYETLTDYMESQVLWQQAMAAKVDAQFQLYLAKVDYNRANGTLVE